MVYIILTCVTNTCVKPPVFTEWFTYSTLAAAPESIWQNYVTRGPLNLYRSPECWGYVELEQLGTTLAFNVIKAFTYAETFGNTFDPIIKIVKVNPGSSYENNGSTQVPDAVYQVSRSSASWFRRRFLKFFTIYGHGHVTWNIWTNFHSPHPMEAPYEIRLQLA